MSASRDVRQRLSAGRMAICALVLAVALTTASATAATPPSKLLDARGSAVASYDGWSAWSRADATTGDYVLMLRSPAGMISPANVSERPAPFDVELGPAGSAVAAVYSRCSNTAKALGCHIFELKIGIRGATEQILAAPGTSVHQPAIWGEQLVFLRRDPGGGMRRPDNLFAWRIGATQARSLTLPASRGLSSEVAGRWPSGQTGAISGLTLHGQQLAYSTSSSD